MKKIKNGGIHMMVSENRVDKFLRNGWTIDEPEDVPKRKKEPPVEQEQQEVTSDSQADQEIQPEIILEAQAPPQKRDRKKPPEPAGEE